jgi:hypothetical protein
MRSLLVAGAMTLALGGTAFAQMCGGAQATATTAQAGGMSCMGMQQAQASDPMAEKTETKPMMSPCCKNMAMMGGMKPGDDATPKGDMPMAPKQ